MNAHPSADIQDDVPKLLGLSYWPNWLYTGVLDRLKAVSMKGRDSSAAEVCWPMIPKWEDRQVCLIPCSPDPTMRSDLSTVGRLEFVGSGKFMLGGRNYRDELRRGDRLTLRKGCGAEHTGVVFGSTRCSQPGSRSSNPGFN